jgi:hypothetical protein
MDILQLFDIVSALLTFGSVVMASLGFVVYAIIMFSSVRAHCLQT